MGYDIERFTSDVDDGLLCSVCHDVIEDGLMAPCEHVYCANCIRAWLVHDSTCPEDKQTLHIGELRPLFRYMRNSLNKLHIRCRSSQAGCQEVCTLEAIQRHENECQYITAQCPNIGCVVTLELHALQEHCTICPLRIRQCPNGCGLALLSAQDEEHNCAAELHMAAELARTEITWLLTEQQQRAECLLNQQRRHVTQRSAALEADFQQLTSLVLGLTGKLQTLLETGLEREQRLRTEDEENMKLMEMVQSLRRNTTSSSRQNETD